MKHYSSIFMGHIPLGKLFFLRLENALLLSLKGDIVEIVSDYDKLESDLESWCRFKGEVFLGKSILPHCYSYKIKKHSNTHFPSLPNKEEVLFQTLNPSMISPKEHGLAPRGVSVESTSVPYYFELSAKNDVWSENLKRIYEDSKFSQWNASSDIAWSEVGEYDPKMEFAIAQIMTYLVENEFSALYVPAKFLPQVSPYYTEVPLLLSSIIGDEARHIEVFTKRAIATGLGVQYSSQNTQQSLYTLFKEDDYFKSSFLLHIMGEGTFIDLLGFLESYAQDEPTKKLLNLAKRDESRHVAYGMNNVKNTLSNNPYRIERIKEAVFRRKAYLDELSGESSLLIETLAIFAGGGDSPAQIQRGLDAVEELKAKMEKNRTKRLIECGIDEELANELSKAHTPNFM
ncbi:ferritin-like domain-containing protein [Helicobacter sp. MIT 14-3879]|uniref:ferritin-like domain-containing protein n=1 Tax=Helicobacter sp. MIT 14-3879 TaxID=2040649 RepID=UPI000E1F3637|nr:ferritin-like domain-containing protein [Helicobacter sp. MIT 14-3879]RDU64168.1 DUF455 domain-containing protein [Helicobacter sp. MIT 14-3879]